MLSEATRAHAKPKILLEGTPPRPPLPLKHSMTEWGTPQIGTPPPSLKVI